MLEPHYPKLDRRWFYFSLDSVEISENLISCHRTTSTKATNQPINQSIFLSPKRIPNMPSTRSGKQYGEETAPSTTRSGKQYGSEKPVVVAATKSTSTTRSGKQYSTPKRVAAAPQRFASLEHKFVQRPFGKIYDEKYPNYLWGTHHFILTLEPEDATSVGFDKLELVFKVYHGSGKGPSSSFAVKNFIVHRGVEEGLLITDPDTHFWRPSTDTFNFALYHSDTFADEIGKKLIKQNSKVLQIFVDALKAAQKDMERVVTKVIRRKLGVFKLDDNIKKMFNH